MRRIRIECLECGKQVVVSSQQPCYYCGRRYPDEEIDQLLKNAQGEMVELDKLLDEKGPPIVPESPQTQHMPWRKLAYAAAIMFFALFMAICALLLYRVMRK